MRRILLSAVLVSACGEAGETGDGGSGGESGESQDASSGDPTGSSSTTSGSSSTATSTTSDTTGSDADTGSESVTTTGGADDGSGTDTDGSSSTGATRGPDDGTMRVLAYNVAGLPDLISGSDPLVNTPLMSPLLNAFDLVLVQEDFSYHAQLSADAEHPHQSTPGGGGTLGDGLNRFSQTPFEDFEREGWIQCNGIIDSGSDCLTEKGFSVGLHTLGPAAQVDVYNLHMDAGGSQGDIEARQAQIQQLVETIEARSAGRAVIVAGDTNMDEEDEADFVTLLDGAGLTDACRELGCGEPFRIDRIMFRNSDTVELTPTSWLVDPSFVDGDGDDLSDHEAVVVEFDWAAI